MSRILVIDDDAALRTIVRKMLEADHEVVEAANGNEGLTLFRQGGADLVISDLIMPDRDGIETIQELREGWPGVKILAMSGGGSIDPRERLIDAELLGADASLLKPFTMASLRVAVAELLARGSGPRI